MLQHVKVTTGHSRTRRHISVLENGKRTTGAMRFIRDVSQRSTHLLLLGLLQPAMGPGLGVERGNERLILRGGLRVRAPGDLRVDLVWFFSQAWSNRGSPSDRIHLLTSRWHARSRSRHTACRCASTSVMPSGACVHMCVGVCMCMRMCLRVVRCRLGRV